VRRGDARSGRACAALGGAMSSHTYIILGFSKNISLVRFVTLSQVKVSLLVNFMSQV
jgi:hypothetical protein